MQSYKCTVQRCGTGETSAKYCNPLQDSNINIVNQVKDWKMNSHGSSKSSSGADSSILRDFSPDLGYHDDMHSPMGSITDFQDEGEKIEGSRFEFKQH